MKVLLVFPSQFIGTSTSTLHRTINEESGDYPPLGMMYIATALNNRTHHTAEILDCRMLRLGSEDVADVVRHRNPDVVGVYFFTEFIRDSKAVTDAVKKINPSIITIAGGPHIYNYPLETIEIPSVDYCFYGEAEEGFAEFLDALESGGAEAAESVEGIISRNKKNLPPAPRRIKDINTLPFPDRRLVDIHRYRSFITHSNPTATLMTSRGCAFNCYYCNSIERAHKVRMVSATGVIAELKDAVSLGIRDFLFFDENFTYDIRRVEEICRLIIDEKLKIRWHCRSRADMKLDEGLLEVMKKAGCRMIQFGIETATPRLQKLINKNLNLDSVRRTLAAVKKAGIMTYGNFILGLPTETEEEMRATACFPIENNMDYASFSIFIPFPDSVFYEQGLKSGEIPRDFWREYVKDPEGHPLAYYWWPAQNKEVVEKNLTLAIRGFYLRPSYLLKAIFRRQSFRQKLWQARAALRLFF